MLQQEYTTPPTPIPLPPPSSRPPSPHLSTSFSRDFHSQPRPINTATHSTSLITASSLLSESPQSLSPSSYGSASSSLYNNNRDQTWNRHFNGSQSERLDHEEWTPPSSFESSTSTRYKGKGRARTESVQRGELDEVEQFAEVVGSSESQNAFSNATSVSSGQEKKGGDDTGHGTRLSLAPVAHSSRRVESSSETIQASSSSATHSNLLQSLSTPSLPDNDVTHLERTSTASSQLSQPSSTSSLLRRSRPLPRLFPLSVRARKSSASTSLEQPSSAPPHSHSSRSLSSLTRFKSSSSSSPSSPSTPTVPLISLNKKRKGWIPLRMKSTTSSTSFDIPPLIGTETLPISPPRRSLSAPALHLNLSALSRTPFAHLHSHNSPYPSPTPSAFVTALSTPILENPPPLLPPSLKPHFDSLPRELQLRILRELIHVCVEEHAKEVARGDWRGVRTSRERWVGEGKGRRELLKCARVSRSWLSLAYDGQLWGSLLLSLLGSDTMSSSALARLMEQSGTFVQVLDLRGKVDMGGETLVELVTLAGAWERGHTSFTSVDLTGCTSLTTSSLSYLISHSPHLEKLSLLALRSVNESTITCIGEHCLSLTSLNIARCPNIDEYALFNYPSPFLSPPPASNLQDLRIAHIGRLSHHVLTRLLPRHPQLRFLDASSNSGIRALPAFGKDSLLEGLKLSDCPLLRLDDPHQDRLPPSLRTLELANCPLLEADPLGQLLSSLPNLIKLDLEGCPLVDDTVLNALSSIRSSQLDTLLLSACTLLTDAGLRSFLSYSSAGKNLGRLELDGTEASEGLVRQFVARQLVNSSSGALLSVLDNRRVGRNFYRDLLRKEVVRPREGKRGWWTRVVGYHEPEPGMEVEEEEEEEEELDECDETRVVLRCFHGHAMVDEADRERRKREGGGPRERPGVQWSRASCLIS